jgi:hypothetical protein
MVRKGLLAMVLNGLLAACAQPSPVLPPDYRLHHVDAPYETGNPWRKLDSWSGIGVAIYHEGWDYLEDKGAYAYTFPSSRTGTLVCEIYLPYEFNVTPADYSKLLIHELQHCTGQWHKLYYDKGLKHFVNDWQP